MNLRRQTSPWLLAGVGALALAGFLIAGASLFLSALSLHTAATAGPQTLPSPAMRWSDIESPNDADFAANLRTIGCPEQAIAVLLAARVAATTDRTGSGVAAAVTLPAPAAVPYRAAAYAAPNAAQVPVAAAPVAIVQQAETTPVILSSVSQGGQVDSFVATKGGGSARPYRQSESTVAARAAAGGIPRSFSNARRPQAGQSLAAAQEPMGDFETNSADSEAEVITAPEGDVDVPVAFQDPSGKESDVEKAALETVQERFVKDIGGTGREPSDPEYQADWAKAQQLSDERYRAMFGHEALLARQKWALQHPESEEEPSEE